MPANCPVCQSDRTHVNSSSLLHNGTRRRRRRCHHCGHAWTEYDGPRPPHKGGSNAARGYGITSEEVEEILKNQTLNHSEMAAKLNLHKATVRNVRLGNILRHVHPELQRWTMGQRPTRTCEHCTHWCVAACGMGYPDPLQEGPAFAADCDLFVAA